jgi:hypothetical protein
MWDRRHLMILLEPDPRQNVDEVMAYTSRYLGQFGMDIYWGTPLQFVTELHTRWQSYLEDSEW